MRLLDLPVDILLGIMGFLEIEDQFHLGLCCEDLRFLFYHDEICQRNLLNCAPFSVKSKPYSRAWRSLAKRMIAVETARPWLLSVIALCSGFIYNDSVVVYCVEQSIRILHLQGSIVEEVAIDIPRLLRAAHLDGLELETLTLLHYACGFVSSLLKVRGEGTQYWLVSCHAEGEVLLSCELVSTRKIFVRNSEDYLYFGVLVHGVNNDNEQWSLRSLNLGSRQVSSPFLLPEVFGSKIGQDTTFKIIDNYFYGVSIVQPLANDCQQRSFYLMFRFRLGSHPSDHVLPEASLQRVVWEGSSIDNNWSTIDLMQCERTGRIFITETGKEVTATGYSQRFCYRKEISPPGHESTKDETVMVHIGDQGSTGRVSTSTNTPIGWYNFLTESFVDLTRDFDLTRDSDTTRRPHLRLRSRSGRHDRNGENIHVWPPIDELDALRVLNPFGDGSVIAWAADDRHILYLSGRSKESEPMLILVSFDPQLQLFGLKGSSAPLPESIPASLEGEFSNRSWSDRVRPFYLSFSRLGMALSHTKA